MAIVVPENEIRFREETPLVFSDRERDRFLQRRKPLQPSSARSSGDTMLKLGMVSPN